MLDIRVIRENPEAVRSNLARRNDQEVLRLYDELLVADREWRRLFTEVG
ncbi:MAG: serine--tRNA ligase, partial [Candidatus Methanosuratus sp.]|nr:serine--tRNA ligase [Candidatus Methanosuratincola sp.]